MRKNQAISKQFAIEKRIFGVRGFQVMIDRDLAELYGVQTKRLNEQVKRNGDRFPVPFCFQLTVKEKNEVVANCDHLAGLKFSKSLPYVFTEQGVAMLSAVLHSEMAVKVSVQIMGAFVAMRKVVSDSSLLLSKLEKLEQKQLLSEEKFEVLFQALENKQLGADTGIFFDGQVFDAYHFVSTLVRKAKKSIVLIDNYIDDSILTLFGKCDKKVQISIYTHTISKQLQLDAAKFNQQYNPLSLHQFRLSHDRFLLLDECELYHFGASLKDLGKKWFAFSKMDTASLEVMQKLC